MKIDFLPISNDDFEFSDLFEKTSASEGCVEHPLNYPFKNITFFFENLKSLECLHIDERRIAPDNFGKFKNIFLRGDYFYLIAYHYFINVKDYSFEQKSEGIMRILDHGSYKNISFFELLYNALQAEKNKSQTLLRHEYTITKSRFNYINSLTKLLLTDFERLDIAVRKNENVFAKYGMIIREVYVEIFKDFHANFIDYLTNENFQKISDTAYPSKKEVQSFRFAKRKNWKKVDNLDARNMVLNRMLSELKNEGFVSENTTFEQLNDLFNNKRRELPKIVWHKSLTALHTFYHVLKENKIVEDAENKHWKILADFFILGDSDINFKELANKKRSTDLHIVNCLEDFLHFISQELYA
jgi:hypothetical protein